MLVDAGSFRIGHSLVFTPSRQGPLAHAIADQMARSSRLSKVPRGLKRDRAGMGAFRVIDRDNII